MEHWTIYILKSLSKNKYYKGMTSNLEGRLQQHNAGEVRTTASMRLLRLIHAEICGSREEARKLEKFFKSGYGREIIREIDIF